MGRSSSSSLLFGGMLAAFVAGSASAQQSCVQVTSAKYVHSTSEDVGNDYLFEMEGRTTVAANTVNVAVVIDSSSSVNSDEHFLEKEFAKNAVASFSSRNLFDNGGMASFAQFGDAATNGGTFDNIADFDDHVDNVPRTVGGRADANIARGLAKGRELLHAYRSTASFLILVTDGIAGRNPKAAADAARAEGITVYVVGVGDVPVAALQAIGGGRENVFGISDFEELTDVIDDIVRTSAMSIPCEATNAVVTMQFNGEVTSASVEGGSASFVGNEVIFEVPDLEATPTSFSVVVDTCAETPRSLIVANAFYADDQGNSPNMAYLLTEGVVNNAYCDGETVPSASTQRVPPRSMPFKPATASRLAVPMYDPMLDYSYMYEYDYVHSYAFEYTSYEYTYDSWYDDKKPPAYERTAYMPWYDHHDYDYGYSYGSYSFGPADPMGPTGGERPPPPSAYTVPMYEDGGSVTMCSNGVPGVESYNGKACCHAGCGPVCGGIGCSRFGEPPLDAHDCCASEIVDEGDLCSDTRTAPCYIDDKDTWTQNLPPQPRSATPMDTDSPPPRGGGGGKGASSPSPSYEDDVYMYSFSFSYDYDYDMWY
eukprot:g5800.t1